MEAKHEADAATHTAGLTPDKVIAPAAAMDTGAVPVLHQLHTLTLLCAPLLQQELLKRMLALGARDGKTSSTRVPGKTASGQQVTDCLQS